MTFQSDARKEQPFWMSGAAVVLLAVAAFKLLLQLLAGPNYGLFRDELYFIDASKHLAWGYLDFPPLIALVAWAERSLLGQSNLALRLAPALAGAAKVVLVGMIARQLGGGRFAQGLAALTVVTAPGFLGADHLLTMNAFEPLFWAGCAYLFIRIVKTGNARLWVGFGVIAGLGLENKYSMLFFGFAFLIGVLLTRERRLLSSPWPWIGGLVALAIFMPNLVWQFHHGFPTLPWLAIHHRSPSNLHLTPVEFMADQVLALQPLSLPVWAGGLWFYLGASQGKPFRALGWTFLIVLGLMLALNGRVYYLLPAYPMLLGAGGVWMESLFNGWSVAALKPAFLALLIIGGALTAPFMLPILPVETYIRYAGKFDLDPPDIEARKLGRLPQLYADMYGWRQLTAAVATARQALPPDERNTAGILASNYGEAAAINFYGSQYGLPRAISPHQMYYLWGPGDFQGQTLILAGHNAVLESQCASILQAGFVNNPYSMPYEQIPVLVCRGLKRPLPQLWPKLQFLD
jgi:hypothetical protein